MHAGNCRVAECLWKVHQSFVFSHPPTHPSICPAIHASEIWQQLLAWRSLYNNTLNSQLTKSGSDTSKRDMRKVSTRRCVDFHEILCVRLICSCGSWGASVVSCHPLGRLSWGRVCNRLSTSSYKCLDNMQTIDACLYDILVVLYTRVRIAPSFGTKRHLRFHSLQCRVTSNLYLAFRCLYTGNWKPFLEKWVVARSHWKAFCCEGELFVDEYGWIEMSILYLFIFHIAYSYYCMTFASTKTSNFSNLDRFGKAQKLESSSDLDVVVSAVQKELVADTSLTTLHCKALQEFLQKPDLDKAAVEKYWKIGLVDQDEVALSGLPKRCAGFSKILGSKQGKGNLHLVCVQMFWKATLVCTSMLMGRTRRILWERVCRIIKRVQSTGFGEPKRTQGVDCLVNLRWSSPCRANLTSGVAGLVNWELEWARCE